MIIDAPEVEQQQLKQAPPPESIARLPRNLEVERVGLLDHVKTMEVSSQQTYEEMAALQVSAATLIKKAEVFFEDHLGLAKLRDSYQTLLRAKKEVVDSLEEARKLASKKNGNFLAEQERIRQEAQRKAEEEARRLAEEQRRKELEAAKKEGATKKELKALEQQPLDVQSPAVEPTYEKVASVSRPIADWSATPANGDESKALMELVKAVAQGKQPIIAVLPNYTYLNQQAKSLKGLMRIPGWKATVSYRTSTHTGRK